MTGDTAIPRFEIGDVRAKGFFDEHGYVILREVLDEGARDLVRVGWDDVVSEAAATFALHERDFVIRFPQNRDLWRKHDAFRHLLFETRQAEVATWLLGVSGVRLLHDHAIAKPRERSGTIPWHQDSSYWPVDRAGLSLWTPTADVSEVGGCLAVLDGSHLDGPAAPEDFLASGDPWQDGDPRLLLLPVRAGETVALHGLTWHSSAPNSSGTDRLAYLSLWVPSAARYSPTHADWHPVVAHVEVEEGERFGGDWFPLFGAVPTEDEGLAVRFPAPTASEGPTMFRAGAQIAAHIAWLLGESASSLSVLLSRHSPLRIAEVVVASGIAPAGCLEALRDVVTALGLADQVRRQSVARDVYLGATGDWWRLAGAAIQERMVGSSRVV